MIIIEEESTTKRFNGADIDHTRLYVKKNCGGFIRSVLDSHEFSDTGNKEEKFIESVHPDSVKELEITT